MKYTAYCLVNRGALSQFAGDVSGLSGEMMTRPTQEPAMFPVVDENGQATGDWYQDGWIIGGEDGTETEEVPVHSGGYVLLGRHENYSAVKIESPDIARLRNLGAQYPLSYFVIMLYDETTTPPWDDGYVADESVLALSDAKGHSTDLKELNSALTRPEVGLHPVNGTTFGQIWHGILSQCSIQL